MCSVTQLCPTLCDPIDCIPPGSSVHWTSQARILEWVVISSKEPFWPRDHAHISCISCISSGLFAAEPSGKPYTLPTLWQKGLLLKPPPINYFWVLHLFPERTPQICWCHSNFYVKWMLWDDLDEWDGALGGEEIQDGGDKYVHVADSLHCTAEANTTL